MIEDRDDTAERNGGERSPVGQRLQSDIKQTVGWNALAKAYLFENLIGNWDWRLGITKSAGEDLDQFQLNRLWNVDFIVRPDATESAMPHDFDMASFVNGRDRLTGNMASTTYLADQPRLKRYLAWEVIRATRANIPRMELLKARDFFLSKRSMLKELITEPEVDPEGVINAVAHLDAFFSLVTDKALNVPMVTQEIKTATNAATGGKTVCTSIKPGWPVRVLQKMGTQLEIEFLGLGCSEKTMWVPAKNIEIP